MPAWVNRTVVQAARNGTTTQTVNFTAATSGNFLIAMVFGGVTSTTPTGWTLNTGCSAINSGGLYVWTKTAAAGESSFTTTNNAANYPLAVVVYEYPAGTTFVKAVSDAADSQGSANPTLATLTGTNTLLGVAGNDRGSGVTGTSTAAWSGSNPGTKDVDISTAFATTDGYGFTVTYIDGSALTSWSAPVTFSPASGVENEKIMLALNVPSGTSFSGSVALSGSGTVAPAGTPRPAATLALSGSGSLTFASTPRPAGALALSGSGTLALSGAPRAAGSLALSGTGTLTAQSATPPVGGSLALSATGTLTLSGVGRGYRFVGPVQLEWRPFHRYPRTRLFNAIPYGLTVWRDSTGAWQQQFAPSLDQLAGASVVYGGGRVWPLTDQQRADLIAAGYGAYITLELIT